ncbi:MAG: hypothetical protein IIB00_02500 [candidate division Zixibacteria bacterium]|nr:hypothetical protein [candidate division Zixibacteria bacterium]
MKEHKSSDSTIQRQAEVVIRARLEKELGCNLVETSKYLKKLKLDGFCDSELPILIEIWAHQGRAKPAQQAKVMKDMCRLLLAEKLLGKPCRKIFVVSDQIAISHLKNSWQGEFAKSFGIETKVIPIDSELKRLILLAQKRQKL